MGKVLYNCFEIFSENIQIYHQFSADVRGHHLYKLFSRMLTKHFQHDNFKTFVKSKLSINKRNQSN